MTASAAGAPKASRAKSSHDAGANSTICMLRSQSLLPAGEKVACIQRLRQGSESTSSMATANGASEFVAPLTGKSPKRPLRPTREGAKRLTVSEHCRTPFRRASVSRGCSRGAADAALLLSVMIVSFAVGPRPAAKIPAGSALKNPNTINGKNFTCSHASDCQNSWSTLMARSHLHAFA